MILATFFHFAFQNMGNDFKDIKIAVIDNQDFKNNVMFQGFLDNVSSGEDKLFDVTYTSQTKADQLLDDSEITGYLLLQPEPILVAKDSGIEQSIIKSFLDNYHHATSTITNIAGDDPAAIGSVINNLYGTSNLKEVSISKNSPDTILALFYALIAMACLSGGTIAIVVVLNTQANLSAKGARINVAPIHKLKVFATSVMAAVTIQFCSVLLLIGYLKFVIGINFGDQLGYLLFACLSSTFTGSALGIMVATLLQKKEGLTIGIYNAIYMVFCFFAGLMISDIKYIVGQISPILNYLNPAALISDSFFALYYYTTYTTFFIKVGALWGLTLIFCLVSYLVLRRQKYASL